MPSQLATCNALIHASNVHIALHSGSSIYILNFSHVFMVKTFKILSVSILKYVAHSHKRQSPYCAVQKQDLFLLSTCVTRYPLKKLSPYFPTLRSPQPLVRTIILFNFYEINFVRLHRWVRSCGVCLSVPGLFNLTYYFQVLAMLFKITMFQSFQDRVPFHIYTFICQWVLRFVPNA